MNASKTNIRKSLESLNLTFNDAIVDLAFSAKIDNTNLDFDLDRWYHSDKRPATEGVDYEMRYFDEKHPNGRVCWI